MTNSKNDVRKESAPKSSDKKSYQTPVVKKVQKLADVTGQAKVTGAPA